MPVSPIRPLTAFGCLLALACGPRWQARAFPTHPELFRAALAELEAGRAGNALSGFERLSLELGLRDSLYIRTQYYLGVARMEEDQWLLAADAFVKLVGIAPDDTLADDALLNAGRSYSRMWREPDLTADYGKSAIAVLGTLAQNYPTSPLVPAAEAEIARITEMLAEKDYLVGTHYIRRNFIASGLTYLKDVIRLYPATRRARDSHIKLAEAYRKVGYTEDLREICVQATERYPADAQVTEACAGALPTPNAASTLPVSPRAPPPSPPPHG